MNDKLEILYIDEDEILINPYRDRGYTMRFPRRNPDTRQHACQQLWEKIDDKSTIVSISVKVNVSYLEPFGIHECFKRAEDYPWLKNHMWEFRNVS